MINQKINDLIDELVSLKRFGEQFHINQKTKELRDHIAYEFRNYLLEAFNDYEAPISMYTAEVIDYIKKSAKDFTNDDIKTKDVTLDEFFKVIDKASESMKEAAAKYLKERYDK